MICARFMICRCWVPLKIACREMVPDRDVLKRRLSTELLILAWILTAAAVLTRLFLSLLSLLSRRDLLQGSHGFKMHKSEFPTLLSDSSESS
jgi:hypothetical protein